MGKALIIVVGVVLAVYAFFDLLATDRRQIRLFPKFAWLAIVLVIPFVGPLLWILLGTQRIHVHPSQGGQPEGPGGPRGPDDDPDFLRGL